MARKQLVASVCWAGALAVALVMGRPAGAQDAPKDPPKPATEAAPEKTEKPVRVSLPAYFGKIIDAKQREQIYAILREYTPKIRELQAQLDAVKADRDKKIDALLTPEQRKTLAELKEAAQAKRKAAAEAKAAERAKAEAEKEATQKDG